MPPQTKFTIADITTAIEWAAGQFEFEPPEAYQPFLSDDEADIFLELHVGLPEVESSIKIFESPPIWNLFRNGDKSVINIFESHAGLERVLVLPSNFQRADLYFAEPGDQFRDPFFGPTLELLMINYLARGHGVIIHACGIEYDGKGLLFAGESGAGKSTLANLWNSETGATVISDDRSLVREIDGELRMYGTPWHGEAEFGVPQGVKLEQIFFLRQGVSNTLRALSNTETVLQLLQCSFPPHWDAAGMNFTLEFFENLTGRLSCHELAFTPDESALECIKRNLWHA